MPARYALPGLILLLVLLVGCAPTPDAALLTPLALPTVTPSATSLPTETPAAFPPTWTPSPSPAPTCGQIVSGAAEAAPDLCGGMALGEACFAAPRAGLSVRPGAAIPAFAAPGDRAPLALAARLDTLAFDPPTNTWGLAALRVQAGSPGQSVYVVMYGEATIFDTGDGLAPFQHMAVHTGFADPQCASAPLPGVLIQSEGGTPADLVINGLPLRFSGTLLVRAQGQGNMTITVLAGQAESITLDGTPFTAPAGTAIHSPLGGDSGFVALGPVTLEPMETAEMAFLPLVALPLPVGIGPAVFATESGPSGDIIALPPTETPIPSDTPAAPFYGTPPGGVYLTFSGKRITAGSTVTGVVPEGGRDRWVFTPVGVGPDSFDYFEVTALGTGWDPVLTIESATWGVYEADYNPSDSNIEVYSASLAGSGGDWRITIRDANGGGGGYTLRYVCRGACDDEGNRNTPTPGG